MLDLIYISSLREKVRCLEGEQAPAAVSDSRERYVPWTRPVKSSAQKRDLDRPSDLRPGWCDPIQRPSSS
jgi:hypothetical protein